jgi:hypothetical protein
MRSPSGGKARHRGGTQVGKAPPSPEMTISGLTESGMSAKIKSPDSDLPGFAGRCGPPLRRAVSFLGVESPQQITSAVGPAGPMKSTARAQTSPKTGQASRQQCTTHEQDKAPQRLPTREVQEEHVTASREEHAPEDHIITFMTRPSISRPLLRRLTTRAVSRQGQDVLPPTTAADPVSLPCSEPWSSPYRIEASGDTSTGRPLTALPLPQGPAASIHERARVASTSRYRHTSSGNDPLTSARHIVGVHECSHERARERLQVTTL